MCSVRFAISPSTIAVHNHIAKTLVEELLPNQQLIITVQGYLYSTLTKSEKRHFGYKHKKK